MKLTTTRRTLMMGAAATLALPAYIRRTNAQTVIRVAGVHASPVENAWNSRIHLAMQEAAASGLIEYEFSEGVAATDYPRAMREYAEAGAQLVWGESYAVEREAREVAADYAETAFLMGSSGGPEGDNFGVFGTRNHEAAYLAGMLAGAMSETGRLRFGRRLPDPGGEPPDQRLPHGRDRGEPRRALPQRLYRRVVRSRSRAGNGHRPDRPGAPTSSSGSGSGRRTARRRAAPRPSDR
jgi:hypothetical protein